MSDSDYRWSLRKLPRDREPGRDLWAGVAAAIGKPVARREDEAGSIMRTVASALVASLVLGAFGLGLARPSVLESVGLRRATPEHQLVLNEAAAMRKQYQVALRRFGNKPVPIAVTPALIELDQSADQIMVALQAHPDAVFLLDQLRRTYARRLQLTQRVTML